MVSLLLTSEPNDCPCHSSTGAADSLNPVVAILQDERVIAIGDNYGRWVPALLCELVQRVDARVPVVLVYWTEDWVPGRAGQTVELVER